jgi:hypothetical protein
MDKVLADLEHAGWKIKVKKLGAHTWDWQIYRRHFGRWYSFIMADHDEYGKSSDHAIKNALYWVYHYTTQGE